MAGLLESIEDVFSGTESGEAEIGAVGWNYHTATVPERSTCKLDFIVARERLEPPASAL
jgi:hypothetical protein